MNKSNFIFFAILIGIVLLIWSSRSYNFSKQQEEKDNELKRVARVEYKKSHPEENKTYSILSAKYGLDVLVVQELTEEFLYKHWHENIRSYREIIFQLSKEFNISESVIASILIDQKSLDFECDCSE